MSTSLDRTDARGLLVLLVLSEAVVVALNVLIFALGWQARSSREPAFLPPPIVIAAVWLALFACMAVARWELNRAHAGKREKAALFVLFGLCATYPFYTAGLSNDLIGEAAALGLLVLTGLIVAACVRSAPRSSAWLAPLVAWLAFESIAGAFALAKMA